MRIHYTTRIQVLSSFSPCVRVVLKRKYKKSNLIIKTKSWTVFQGILQIYKLYQHRIIIFLFKCNFKQNPICTITVHFKQLIYKTYEKKGQKLCKNVVIVLDKHFTIIRQTTIAWCCPITVLVTALFLFHIDMSINCIYSFISVPNYSIFSTPDG